MKTGRTSLTRYLAHTTRFVTPADPCGLALSMTAKLCLGNNPGIMSRQQPRDRNGSEL